MSKEPAVFLDRDGTIIEDRGHLHSPQQVHFIDGVVEALQNLQQSYRLFIVTHQGGIAEGLISAEQAQSVNSAVVNRLAAQGVRIEEVYTCPHAREEDCECIKPKPYALHQAARKHGIDLQGSYVIGDHQHDVDLARNAGAQGLYVLTGHGAKHRDRIKPKTTVVEDLPAAAAMILQRRA